MDFIRHGRYVIPSFLFFLSLLSLWSASGPDIETVTAKELTVAIAVLGAATLPLGFFIGGVSVLILRLIFFVGTLGDWNYEVRVSEGAWGKISEFLGTPFQRSERVVAGSAFQLELPDNVFLWIDRRWNAFNVYINSLVAIALAYLCGAFALGFHPTVVWTAAFLLIALVAIMLAIGTWRSVMAMTELQARRVTHGKSGRDPEGRGLHPDPAYRRASPSR